MSRLVRPEPGATSARVEIRRCDKERKALCVLAFKGKIDTRTLKGQALVVKEKMSAECRCAGDLISAVQEQTPKIKKMVGYAAKFRRKGGLCQIFLTLFFREWGASPVHPFISSYEEVAMLEIKE